MYKIKKKLILLVFFSLCIFILVSSASAANYYVNNDTTHKNITDWMKNNAKSGDKLIFNTTTYELSDKIVINKQIKIVSYKNTHVNFRKHDNMFDVKKNTSFTGLNLNHYGENKNTYYSFKNVIYSNSKSYIKINLKNTNINNFANLTQPISINKWVGTINKCNIYNNDSFGIYSKSGKVNIIDSNINTNGRSIEMNTWRGNLINSIIISRKEGSGIISDNWKGKIIGSKIYSNKHDSFYGAVYLGLSKGIIKNSIIKSNSSYALKTTDNVKITKSSISSKNKLKSIHRFKQDLNIEVSPIDYNWVILPKKGSYEVTIYNTGYKSSESCYLSFKTMKISKKYYIKPLKPDEETVIKITFNPKYMTKEMNIKYPKVFKVDCYNKIKEEKKDNNKFTIDKGRYENL